MGVVVLGSFVADLGSREIFTFHWLISPEPVISQDSGRTRLALAPPMDYDMGRW